MSADHRIPDILLERYRLNELPKDEADRMAARLGQDALLRERLAGLEASDEELRRGNMADRLEQCTRRKLAEAGAKPRRWSLYWALPVVAAAAIVVIAVAARNAAPPAVGSSAAPPPAGAEDRVKGVGPALALYRRTAEGSETLADGAVARRGDLIRVGYRAAGRSYGAIVSIDGAGSVTMHLPPAAGGRAAPLKHEATVLLDEAYELDDAPLWERFYFIAGDAPFDTAPVMQAAREAAKTSGLPPAGLALPRGLEQSNFTLQKESKP